MDAFLSPFLHFERPAAQYTTASIFRRWQYEPRQNGLLQTNTWITNEGLTEQASVYKNVHSAAQQYHQSEFTIRLLILQGKINKIENQSLNTQ